MHSASRQEPVLGEGSGLLPASVLCCRICVRGPGIGPGCYAGGRNKFSIAAICGSANCQSPPAIVCSI